MGKEKKICFVWVLVSAMQQGLQLSVKATLSFDTCVLSQEGICPFERESVGWEQSGHLCIIGAR